MNTTTIDRALGLAVEHIGGRRYRVASYSGAAPHIVHGAADTPLGDWTCDCRASAGRRGVRCAHKTAVALELGVDVTTLFSSLGGEATAGASVPAVAALGANDTTGGTMRDAADGELMTFRCTVPPIMSAVKVDGGPDGGVRLQIDVPGADEAAALAFVKACRGRVLRLVVVDESDGA